MAKVFLLSVVLVNIYLPLLSARDDRNPRQALQRMVQRLAIYAVVYFFALLLILPHIGK